jgi:hypothetical protein
MNSWRVWKRKDSVLVEIRYLEAAGSVLLVNKSKIENP